MKAFSSKLTLSVSLEFWLYVSREGDANGRRAVLQHKIWDCSRCSCGEQTFLFYNVKQEMSSFLWTNSTACQVSVSAAVQILLSHLKTRVVDKAEPPNCNMFISCGAQRCLYSCWGFLPHLVITRRQRAASALLAESKTWFKEVWRQRDEGPLRATRTA